MRRFWVILVALLLVLSLWGCAQQEKIYTIDRNGLSFSVDTEHQTISDGTNIYHYVLSDGASSSTVTITYPDGSTFWDTVTSRGSGSSGWSDDYKDDAYVSGWTLADVVRQTMPEPANTGMIIGGLILIALGVCSLAFPRGLWFLGYGWHFKSAEPSDAALGITRVSGIVTIILGVVLLLK